MITRREALQIVAGGACAAASIAALPASGELSAARIYSVAKIYPALSDLEGELISYVIQSDDTWEAGIGVYDASASTLRRIDCQIL